MSAARRLVVAAGAGLLALVTVAPPAWAEHLPEVTLTSPTTLDAQGLVTGTIAVDEAEEQTLTKAEYTLVPDPEIYESNVQADPCFVDLPANDKVKTFPEGATDTGFTFDVGFPCNRAYQLQVDVSYEDPEPLPLTPRRLRTTSKMLPFSVAIRPTKVQGLAANYDAGTREVLLTWAPNPEPDAQYYVERTPPGEPRFARIGDGVVTGTEFRDPDIGDPQIYRVTAVRPEPPGGQIEGEPSTFVLSGPAPPDVPPPPSNQNAGGPANRDAGNPPAGRRSSPSGSRGPSSNIFEETLPFDPSRTTTIPPDTIPATEPPGDAAVLAEFDDVSDEEQQRATLVPVAGGLALIVGALHLLLLSKRAGESDIPIVHR